MRPAELRLLPEPPEGAALQALWWSAKGNWEAAHRCAQDGGSVEADWVHAYLHRVEGDLANAGYWYASAGKRAATGGLDAEWEAIADALLKR